MVNKMRKLIKCRGIPCYMQHQYLDLIQCGLMVALITYTNMYLTNTTQDQEDVWHWSANGTKE